MVRKLIWPLVIIDILLVVSLLIKESTIRIQRETIAIQGETIRLVKQIKVDELAQQLSTLEEPKPGFTVVTVYGSTDQLEIGETVRIEIQQGKETLKAAEAQVISFGQADVDIRVYYRSFEVPYGVYTVRVSSRLGVVKDTRTTEFHQQVWWQFDLTPPSLEVGTH